MPDGSDETSRRVAQVMMCGPPLAQLAELALLRRGFGNSDVGFGLLYPNELDELDGSANGSMPPGCVQIYGFFGKEFECVIEERVYLAILAETLRAKGMAVEAAKVERLPRRHWP